MATDPYQINSVEELRRHYDMPNEMVTKTTFNFLDDYAVKFVRQAPIVCIGTEMGEGLDVSPRGGEQGFVEVLDRHHVAIPDWPGNNKLESMTNILTTGRCGLLFLIPGMDLFFRINGPATVTRNPEVIAKLARGGKEPKAAIRVKVNEAYFHCGKAIKRSKIWDSETWPDRKMLPSVGKMIMDQAKLADTTPEEIDELYQKELKENLY